MELLVGGVCTALLNVVEEMTDGGGGGTGLCAHFATSSLLLTNSIGLPAVW